MDINKYIDSGILELYVAGALSEKENQEVYELMQKYPDILDEVLKIESAIIKLTKAASPKGSKNIFEAIKIRLGLNNENTKIIQLKPKTRFKWYSYTGWAACVLFAAGFLWLVNENNQLKNQITTTQSTNEFLEYQIEKANTSLAESKKLISILRDRQIISVPLDGQAVYPSAYAKAYWDKNSKKLYLDVQGLPTPPEGKVYQVWSLKLNPLTPTSLGTLEDFDANDSKIFTIENANESEAFGITLEPAGGSESPTLDQLYTLGAISTT
jgi:anti-sigma-K factor RskA